MTESTHKCGVGTRGLQRSGHFFEKHTRSRRQKFSCLVRRDGSVEFGIDAQAVAGKHGHANARSRHLEVGKLQNLATLVAQLLLFVGFVRAVVNHRTGKGHHVKGDGAHVLDGTREGNGLAVLNQVDEVALIDRGGDLSNQFFSASETRSGDSLKRGDDHLRESRGTVQHLHHGHGRHGGAVGVGDDSLDGLIYGVGVDLAHDERNVRVHAPGAGVIDHEATDFGKTRCVSLGARGTSGEQCHIDTGGIGRGDVFHHDVVPPVVQRLPCRPCRGKETNLSNRHVPLVEQATHDGSHLAGGTHHANTDAGFGNDGHRPVPA